MKGQAHFIEFVLVTLLSIVLVAAIAFLIFGFYRNITENDARQSLRQISIQVSDEATRLYNVARGSRAQPTNYTSLLISEVNLNLPRQISNKNYDVILVSASQLVPIISAVTVNNTNISSVISNSNAKVLTRLDADPDIEVEYDIPNIDVSVQGRANNGQNATLRYYRYNINGTIYDTIVLGPYDIIVSISGVS